VGIPVGYGYGMGMGTDESPLTYGMLWRFLNGLEIKRTRVKPAINDVAVLMRPHGISTLPQSYRYIFEIISTIQRCGSMLSTECYACS